MDQHSLNDYKTDAAPSMIVIPPRLYVAWLGGNKSDKLWWAYLDEFDDWNQATWSQQKEVYPGQQPSGHSPSLANFQNTVFMAYASPGPPTTINIATLNPGDVWDNPWIVTLPNTGAPLTGAGPALTAFWIAGVEHLGLVWQAPNSTQLYFATSADGHSWTSAVPIPIQSAAPPTLFGANGYIFMATNVVGVSTLSLYNGLGWNALGELKKSDGTPVYTDADTVAALTMNGDGKLYSVNTLEGNMYYSELNPSSLVANPFQYLNGVQSLATPAIGVFGIGNAGGLYAVWKGADNQNAQLWWGPIWTAGGISPHVQKTAAHADEKSAREWAERSAALGAI